MGPWDYPFWGFSPYRGRNLTFLFSISFSLTDYIQVVILFTNMSSVVFFVFCKDHSHLLFRSSHLDFWFDSRVWRWMLLKGGSWSQVFFQQLVSYRSAPSHITKSATHAFSCLILILDILVTSLQGYHVHMYESALLRLKIYVCLKIQSYMHFLYDMITISFSACT